MCRAESGRAIVVHGVLVQVSGLGVLLMGDSGIGKTGCGLDLVARGSLWIADDAVVLEKRGDALYGRGHGRTKKLIAVRGLDIIEARSLLGAESLLEETRVHLIIQFIRQFIRNIPEQGPIRGGESGSFLEIAGISLFYRRAAASGGSALMADRVTLFVNQCLIGEIRGSTEEGEDHEADARGNHHRTVRFR